MPQLLLLHGALGSERQMEPLKRLLQDTFECYSFSFEGHGEREVEGELGIARFAENVRVFIKEHGLKKPVVFGYSMGGYVALYLEAQHPGTFEEIITLGTKFNWNPDIAAREVRMLQPEIIEEKVPKFAAHLERMHAPNDWKENMRATADMMERMGDHPPLNDVDLSHVACPVRLTLGGKDNMVTEAETMHVEAQLSNVEFHLFEAFEHPLEKVNVSQLTAFIRKGL